MKTTGIEWTDVTWNPWHGCVKVSPGCKHCYMYRDKGRFGQDPTDVVRSKTTFSAPLKLKEPQLIFTCSWSDFFIDLADEWRNEAWDIIKQTPHLTYQILTKRPERIHQCLPKDWGNGYENVWLGVSGETQSTHDQRHVELLKIPAALHWVSIEPMLEPVDLMLDLQTKDRPHIEWVVAGGESGPKARPSQLGWFRSLRDQCQSAGVPFFMKQITKNGKKISYEDFPQDLKVRKFPHIP